MEVGIASRPKPGESSCGDDYLVIEDENYLLVVVVDGLGHGPLAAQASQAATKFIHANASLGFEKLFKLCDQEITHTRGAAITAVKINRKTLELEHAGVGNVEVNSHTRQQVRPIPQAGVIGGRFRRLKPMKFQMHPGDRIALFSDGISTRFKLETYSGLGAQQIADKILKEWAKEHDDATCAVIVF